MEYRGSKNWLWEMTIHNLRTYMGQANGRNMEGSCFKLGVYGLKRYDITGDWKQRIKNLEERMEILERQ